MPTTAEAYEKVMEALSPIDGITSRKMMGEYLLYCRGKLFGGIYDDRLMVKVTPSSARMLSGRETVPPYEGARGMIVIDDADMGMLSGLIGAMYEELPSKTGRRRGRPRLNADPLIRAGTFLPGVLQGPVRDQHRYDGLEGN